MATFMLFPTRFSKQTYHGEALWRSTSECWSLRFKTHLAPFLNRKRSEKSRDIFKRRLSYCEQFLFFQMRNERSDPVKPLLLATGLNSYGRERADCRRLPDLRRRQSGGGNLVGINGLEKEANEAISNEDTVQKSLQKVLSMEDST